MMGKQGFVDDDGHVEDDVQIIGDDRDLDGPDVQEPAGAQDPSADPSNAPEEGQGLTGEELARAGGWSPEKGDKTWQEFNSYGAGYKDAETRIESRLNRDFNDRLSRMERMSKMREEAALNRQREEIEARYSASTREAVAMGDVAQYDALQREKETKLNNIQPLQVPQDQQGQGVVTPEFQSWLNQNAWFDKPEHAGASAFAVAEMNRLAAENPHVSRHALLPQVNARIAESFPALVGARPRETPRQTTDNGGGRRPSRSKVKGFADMPREARIAGKEFVEDGTFKTEADYAKAYWAQ